MSVKTSSFDCPIVDRTREFPHAAIHVKNLTEIPSALDCLANKGQRL